MRQLAKNIFIFAGNKIFPAFILTTSVAASVAQAAIAGNSLEEITTAVSTIRDMNSQIASAAEEQTARSEEVKRNVEKINEVTELSTQIAERTSSVSNHLIQIVNRLETLIGKFKISA